MAFLFDLDGTLAHSKSAYYAAWKELLADRGMELCEAVYDSFIDSKSDASVLASLLAGSDLSLAELSALKNERYRRHADLLRPVEGAVAFLRACKRLDGHRVAVVTNSNLPSAELTLERLGLLPFVDLVVAAGDAPRNKPAPDPYEEAARRLGVSLRESVAFEDSRTGLASAAAAGARWVVGLATSLTPAELLRCGAHEAVPDFSGLEAHDLAHGALFRRIARCLGDASVDGARVVAARVLGGHLGGGYVASVHAVECRFDAGPPVAVVVKLQQDRAADGDDAFLRTAEQLRLCEREAIFYEVASALVPPALRVPGFHGCLRDVDDRVLGLVLEDLRPPKATWQLAGDDVAERVFRGLAGLHRAFWRAPPLPGLLAEELHASYAEVVRLRLPDFLERQADALTEPQRRLFSQAGTRFAEVGRRLELAPATLCHGDVKAGNLCELPEDGRLCFLDWQYATFGAGARDLAFFLVESRPREDRWAALLDLYHRELGAPDDYDRARLEADVALAGLHFPLFVAIWFGSMDPARLADPAFPSRYLVGLLAFYERFGAEAVLAAA
jgi:HAD superfamily hydrolase (TIGR01509 family)